MGLAFRHKDSRFITLEGGEGTGKSTLARGLDGYLRGKGREVVLTREPGGAPGADAIRALLVSGDVGRWTAHEEALLFAAARLNHLNHTIRPALERGASVVCDRYFDSTSAYQCGGSNLDPSILDELNAQISADYPDLTLILDIDPVRGIGRSRGAHVGEDRFEKKDADFHARVRAAFLDIAAIAPERCKVIDASQTADAVLAEAIRHIEALP
ncbi:MAG: dTMP kinase [Hyphomonadaceae bacterium]|nr:dTMP kinase [Hyphomonadaceae bacterium]